MKLIIKKTRSFVVQSFSDNPSKFGSKFMILMADECVKLADELGKNKNLNLSALKIGIYLHDIGRTITDDKDHNIEGKKIAEKFLAEIGVNDEEILNIVFDCALNHGSDANPITKEGEFMKFLDKAVLINPKLIKIYYDLVRSEIDEEVAKEKVMLKLDKWYNSLTEKNIGLEKSYKECIELVVNY